MTVIEKKFSQVDVNGGHVDVMEIKPFQRNAPEYKCCCHKIHYTKGAFLIALLTVVISVIGILLSVFSNYWFFFIPFVVFLIVAVIVLFAKKMEKKALYLPYVIVMSLLIVASILFVIFFIVLIIVIPNWSQDFVENVRNRHFEDETQKADATRVFFAVAVVVLLVFVAIASWFTWIVYKAYNFMRELEIARNPRKFIMELKTQYHMDEIDRTPRMPRQNVHEHTTIKEVEVNGHY